MFDRKPIGRGTFFAAFFLLNLAVDSPGFGQVPSHQGRIRETTQAILAQPEFGLFPRLGSLGDRRESSRWGMEGRFPGMPSSPGGRGDGEGTAREGAGQNRRAAGPNGLPPDAPDRAPAGNGNPENARDALGEDELFPEAGKLDRLLDDENLVPNPNGRTENEGEDRNLAQNPNGVGENQRNPEPDNENAQRPPPANREQQRERVPAAENLSRRPDRIGNRRSALPAPRPRETSESESPRQKSPREVGELARIVGAVFHGMAWTILAVICGLILWLIVKAVYEFERPSGFLPMRGTAGPGLDLAPAQAPGDLPADVYLAHARRFAENGQYKEAVVQLLLGAMSRVERAGWVRFRRGMTVRDYLRSIHRHHSAHDGFRAIVRAFEPLSFGRREPTEDHFDKSLKGYESGFGSD